MSDREWRFYLEDMIRFAETVISYADGLRFENFISDEKTYDAVLRKLELIGEAATHIPDSVRSGYGIIPWRQIIATRNRIIHGYLGIDNDMLWSIVQDDIPDMLQALKEMAAALHIDGAAK